MIVDDRGNPTKPEQKQVMGHPVILAKIQELKATTEALEWLNCSPVRLHGPISLLSEEEMAKAKVALTNLMPFEDFRMIGWAFFDLCTDISDEDRTLLSMMYPPMPKGHTRWIDYHFASCCLGSFPPLSLAYLQNRYTGLEGSKEEQMLAIRIGQSFSALYPSWSEKFSSLAPAAQPGEKGQVN